MTEPSIWDFATAGLVSGSLMAAGHYLPWRVWLGRDLPRLAAYAWGVGGIVTGFALVAPMWATALLLCAVLSAGIVTLLAWGIDAATRLWQRAHTAEGTINAVERLGS